MARRSAKLVDPVEAGTTYSVVKDGHRHMIGTVLPGQSHYHVWRLAFSMHDAL